MGRSAGSAALVLVGTGTPLHPAPALFEAMLGLGAEFGIGLPHALGHQLANPQGVVGRNVIC